MLSVPFYMVDFEIGRRVQSSDAFAFGANVVGSVVDVRNLGQNEALSRTTVSKGRGLRIAKTTIEVKRPRVAGRTRTRDRSQAWYRAEEAGDEGGGNQGGRGSAPSDTQLSKPR